MKIEWSDRTKVKVLVGVGALAFVALVAIGLLSSDSDGRSGKRTEPPITNPLGGFRERANDRDAQSNARNAVAAANVSYQDTMSYTDLTQDLLNQVEPSLHFEAGGDSPGGNSSPRQIDYLVVSPIRIVMGVESETGACFYAQDNKDVTGVNRGSTFMGPARCVELSLLALNNPGWGDEF